MRQFIPDNGTQAAFSTMLAVQADLNDVMGGVQWRNAVLQNSHGFNYRRAIKVESAEAIAYTPYKWWANVEFQKSQYRMELIDTAHFLLSFTHVVERSAGPFYWANSDELYTVHDAMRQGWHNAEQRYQHADAVSNWETSVAHLESLVNNLYGRHIGTQVTYTSYDLCGAWENLFGAFFSAFPDFNIQELLTEYLTKSVLNRFRTSNGAKEHGLSYNKNDYLENPARYVKVWADGREDTEHLSDIVDEMLLVGKVDHTRLNVEIAVRYEKTIEAYGRV